MYNICSKGCLMPNAPYGSYKFMIYPLWSQYTWEIEFQPGHADAHLEMSQLKIRIFKMLMCEWALSKLILYWLTQVGHNIQSSVYFMYTIQLLQLALNEIESQDRIVNCLWILLSFNLIFKSIDCLDNLPK